MKVYEALTEAFHWREINMCFALRSDANMPWAGARDCLSADPASAERAPLTPNEKG